MEKNDTKFYSKFFKLDDHTFDLVLLSLRNLLANSFLVKCISNESEKNYSVEFTKCVYSILEELIIKNNLENNCFLNFLLSSIKNFHNTHICSTKTTSLISIMLWKNLKKACDCNSLSTKLLTRYLRVVLDDCIRFVKLNFVKKLPIKNKAKNKSKILSRYMSSEKDLNFDITENLEFYKNFLNGISRNQPIITNLLLDYLFYMKEANANFNFDSILITSLATSSLKIHHKTDYLSNNSNIEEFNYKILKGICVQINDNDDENHFEKCSNLNEYEIVNSIFFESSLTPSYAHLGFNKSLKCDYFIKSDLFECNQKESYVARWQKMIEEIFISKNIKLVFVRDNVDKILKEFFKLNSITCVSGLEWDVINWLKEDVKCPSMVYAEQFTKEKIFKCKINLLCDKNTYLKFRYLNIQSFDDDHLNEKFTILIENRLNTQANMYKEHLRHCLKRLHYILNNNGEYLLGSGYVENKLADNLSQDLNLISSVEKDDETVYYDLVKDIFSTTFRSFYQVVLSNCDPRESFLNEPIYFDDCISKFESWKTMCIINQTLLNSDFSFLC